MHRSTTWRRKQVQTFKNDLAEAFRQANNHTQILITQRNDNETMDIDVQHDFNDGSPSVNFDHRVESPVDNNPLPFLADSADVFKSNFESSFMSKDKEELKTQPIHIAIALIALKSRHRLSNQCIEDVLSLLRSVSDNIPSSYKSLCTLLRKHSFAHVRPQASTICPHCEQVSSKSNECTLCGAIYSPIPTSTIPLFYTYDIAHQIETILCSSPDLSLSKSTSSRKSMSDIKDGDFYRKLTATESDNFISLTMNIDGIQPNKGSDQSIWPVLIVINEIDRAKRFALENLIIGGMWPGPSKPTRSQMALFLEKIVVELKALESGHVFRMYSTNEELETKFIKVFLIVSCCDKPAQCLIQCLPEPTAFFGCGSCEIEGTSTATKNDGSVVSFAIFEKDDPAVERSNKRHDFYQEQLQKNTIELANFVGSHGRPALKRAQKKALKGAKGPCQLRLLSKFDVGRSFVFDSLHNLYLGLFKRMLSLWLSHHYKDEIWSVSSKIHELSVRLNRFRFPSTTSRRPRSLQKFAKYKGSEFRIVLLFGYSIFENVLKPEYYSHLLLLVLAVHYAESRQVNDEMVNIVEKLCRIFLLEFPKLYTERHNVQVVHSIIHMASALRKFGPLSAYSTFNFENQLGLLTRSCKSTRRHALEILNNLMYLRDACFSLIKTDVPTGLRALSSSWLSIPPLTSTKGHVRVLHPLNITDSFFNSIFRGKIVFYSTAFIDQVRFTTSGYANDKTTDDSNILFKIDTKTNFARIERIFQADDGEPLFYLHIISNLSPFRCDTSSRSYQYSGISTGSKAEGESNIFITAHDIVEKCVFYDHGDGSCTFYRFPDLQQPS